MRENNKKLAQGVLKKVLTSNDSGTPADNKKLKKWSPFLWNPTIVMPIKMENERPKVMRKWLVTVKL